MGLKNGRKKGVGGGLSWGVRMCHNVPGCVRMFKGWRLVFRMFARCSNKIAARFKILQTTRGVNKPHSRAYALYCVYV